MSPQIHPAGFRISDRPVAASFAYPDSFQPIQEIMLRDEACLTSSLALGGVEGTWVRYWDDASTVAVLEFQVAMPAPSTVVQSGKDKKEKKKKGKGGLCSPRRVTLTLDVESAVRPVAPLAPSALPVSDKPVTLSFNKAKTSICTCEHYRGTIPFHSTLALGSAVKPLALGFSSDDVTEENNEEDDMASGSKCCYFHSCALSLANSYPLAVSSKGVAPLIASKKVYNQPELSCASSCLFWFAYICVARRLLTTSTSGIKSKRYSRVLQRRLW